MTGKAIHVAHAMARKGGTHYRARATVAEPIAGAMVQHSFAIAIDDSADQAERLAVEYVREMYRREGLDAPESVVSHGRKPGAIVDSFLFAPRGVILEGRA